MSAAQQPWTELAHRWLLLVQWPHRFCCSMEYVPEMFQSLVGNWKLPKPDRDAFQKESCGSMTFDNDNVLNEVQ